MSPRALLLRLLFAAGTCALLAAPVAGQGTDPSPEPDVLARLRASGLPSRTDRITVYFPAGAEARALADRDRIQQALRFYADSLGVTPELTLGVLDRATWAVLGVPQPYGIPGVAGRPAVAYVPLTDDGLAATDALSIEAGVGDAARRLLADAGTDWAGAARSHVALVGLHELGHTLVDAYGIAVPTPWLGEWLATYVGYTFMRAVRPREALVWEGVLQGFRDAVQPQHRTLEAFDRLYFGVGAMNYVWYQARFQAQVQAVHAVHGVDFLRRVRTAFPRDGAKVSSHEVIARLEAIAPGFAVWAATMR